MSNEREHHTRSRPRAREPSRAGREADPHPDRRAAAPRGQLGSPERPRARRHGARGGRVLGVTLDRCRPGRRRPGAGRELVRRQPRRDGRQGAQPAAADVRLLRRPRDRRRGRRAALRGPRAVAVHDPRGGAGIDCRLPDDLRRGLPGDACARRLPDGDVQGGPDRAPDPARLRHLVSLLQADGSAGRLRVPAVRRRGRRGDGRDVRRVRAVGGAQHARPLPRRAGSAGGSAAAARATHAGRR